MELEKYIDEKHKIVFDKRQIHGWETHGKANRKKGETMSTSFLFRGFGALFYSSYFIFSMVFSFLSTFPIDERLWLLIQSFRIISFLVLQTFILILLCHAYHEYEHYWQNQEPQKSQD